MINIAEVNLKKEYEEYLQSKEWKDLIEKGRNAVNESYTVIYRESNGELKEAWHYLSEDNIAHIKEKYKKKKLEIVRFVKKELPFGDYLKSISGKRGES